jgi:SNF2 family DNA or RNA helicase
VRVLIGSTQKMGTGTNVQKRLVALHHCDAPWKPAEVEQRDGRILRQGNENEEVAIYRYVTEGSFDAYSGRRWKPRRGLFPRSSPATTRCGAPRTLAARS